MRLFAKRLTSRYFGNTARDSADAMRAMFDARHIGPPPSGTSAVECRECRISSVEDQAISWVGDHRRGTFGALEPGAGVLLRCRILR
jgi:hypothetical protein